MKKTIKVLCAALAALMMLAACSPNVEEPQEPAAPSFEVVEQTPDPLASETDVLAPPAPENEEELLLQGTGNELAVEEMLTTGEPDAFYDSDLNSTFVTIDVHNITKSTLKGGLLLDAYNGDTVVASANMIVDEDDNEDNSIKTDVTVSMVAEFEGRNIEDADFRIRLDPVDPMKAVT